MKERGDTEVKLAIVGAPSVGKSAIGVRFLTRRFISEYEEDVECVYKRDIRFEEDFISYELKDTAGSTCLANAMAYFAWSSSIVVVYSIVDRSSFITAAVLLEEFKRMSRLSHGERGTIPTVAILGNKYDLCHRREVTTEEGRNLALKHGASFYEISASTDYDNVFIPLNTLIVQNHIKLTKESLAESHSQGGEKRTTLQLPSIEEAPGFDRSMPTRKLPNERKQTVRRKLSAAIFKKRSETV